MFKTSFVVTMQHLGLSEVEGGRQSSSLTAGQISLQIKG